MAGSTRPGLRRRAGAKPWTCGCDWWAHQSTHAASAFQPCATAPRPSHLRCRAAQVCTGVLQLQPDYCGHHPLLHSHQRGVGVPVPPPPGCPGALHLRGAGAPCPQQGRGARNVAFVVARRGAHARLLLPAAPATRTAHARMGFPLQVLQNGRISTVNSTELLPGDVVVVHPGILPCDLALVRWVHAAGEGVRPALARQLSGRSRLGFARALVCHTAC